MSSQITIEGLTKFLSDNGVEIPEGSGAKEIISIIEALLPKSDSSNEEEKPEETEKTKEEAPMPMGVA